MSFWSVWRKISVRMMWKREGSPGDEDKPGREHGGVSGPGRASRRQGRRSVEREEVGRKGDDEVRFGDLDLASLSLAWKDFTEPPNSTAKSAWVSFVTHDIAQIGFLNRKWMTT